jgi:regulator of cell morphogenesis and NO signaling
VETDSAGYPEPREIIMNATETTIPRPGGEKTFRRAANGSAPAALLREVCDRILTSRHDPISASLPRIRLLLLKVADAHGFQHPELYRVLAAFGRFADDLVRHLAEEDHVLFPLVGRLEAGEAVADTLAGEVESLDAVHGRIGATLEEISSLTDGFTPPVDACDTYRMLLEELRGLAAGVHQTVAEETDVLFPGAFARAVESSAR